MSTATQYPHLTFDADGTARIGKTRYKVIHLATEHYHHGWTAEELMRQHPDLKPEEVYAALLYFYDHREQLVEAMQTSARDADAAWQTKALSRAELLKRGAAGEP
jgi:uncharacterized protein (DUF433 family)